MSFTTADYEGTRHEAASQRVSMCLACGARMADCLIRTGSPRCHDCRDARTPFRADLVEGWSRVLRLVPPLPAEALPRAA